MAVAALVRWGIWRTERWPRRPRDRRAAAIDYDLEWGHRGLSELVIVNDLHERKRLMIDEVDG